METLTIKTPADVLSFLGHTLGFWPHESLVCITIDTNRIGTTLRVDLPKHDGSELAYARTVAVYLANDPKATSAPFAVYTSGTQGRRREHRLTGHVMSRRNATPMKNREWEDLR